MQETGETEGVARDALLAAADGKRIFRSMRMRQRMKRTIPSATRRRSKAGGCSSASMEAPLLR